MQGFIAAVAAFLALVGPASAQLAVFEKYDAANTQTVDNSAWAKFLSAYVVPGAQGKPALVRYGSVSAEDKAALKGYIQSLEALKPTTLNKSEAFAYWVNLYNAHTVALILDNYPVKSIRDIKSGLVSLGPWGRKVATVEGVSLSLDEIEHKILRAYFNDNRVHFAVNCASIGCPDLKASPWTGATLEADLDAAAKLYVNSPRGVAISGGKIKASSIFKWFVADFGGKDQTVIAFWTQHAAPALKTQLASAKKIDSYAYDWALNETK